ncbi:uncharacterized protein LOC131858388 [Cryptomeria japonica]|uniref:uncharacterized protein LOC131858388 n=1 Tax=Cryptomeria japonica TaxID=3369 RepID=UPI0027DA8C58|nr:uncharacterized protein LOC131858388 [Cryptomeria japonica]
MHKEKGQLTKQDGPPFEITLFRQYLQYTYWACGQVCGEKVLDVTRIGPLVLAIDIQMHEPRPFDYATYLTEKLHEGFLNKGFVARGIKGDSHEQRWTGPTSSIMGILVGLEGLREEGDSESGSDENIAVSTLRALELEEVVESQEQILVRINANADVRLEEHSTFVADEVFVQSKEFKKDVKLDIQGVDDIFIGSRFEHLLEVLREFWTNCQKTLDNMASHKRTLNMLKALLKDKSADEKVVEKIQRRLNKHKAFGVDIKQEVTDCKDIVRGGNGYDNNQNNGNSRGSNGNHGNGNGGNINNNNGNNGNIDGGGDNGNNGNNGNDNSGGFNRGNMNNQTNNQTTATIENNRKVAGKVSKRDDPKLYKSRVPKKDELTQIMDMLKDLKEQCMIAQGFIEEENHNEDCEPTVNVLSFDPYWGRDEDSSEGKIFSNMQQRRENQHYNIRQVFLDDDDEDIPSLRTLFQNDIVPSLRNLTEEENKAFTIATVEQVKSNYQLKNRNVNNEQGKPTSVFAKVKKLEGNTDNTFKSKDANAKKGKEAILGQAKKEDMPVTSQIVRTC